MSYLTKPKTLTMDIQPKSSLLKSSARAAGVKPRVNTAELEILKLERESKSMEERLKLLRETLEKQKERRGSSSFVWKSGNAEKGSLNAYAMDVLAAKNASLKSRYSGIGDELDAKRKQLEDKKSKGNQSSKVSKKVDQGFITVSASKLSQNGIDHGNDVIKPTPPALAKPTTSQPRKPISPDAALIGKPIASNRAQSHEVQTKEEDHEDFKEETKEPLSFESKMWRVPTPACGQPSEVFSETPETIKPISQETDIQSFAQDLSTESESVVSHSLLDGHVDEEQNKKDFMAALNEWRGSGKSKKVSLVKTIDDHYVATAAERDILPPRQATTGTETLPIKNDSVESVLAAGKEIFGLSYTQKLLLNKYRQKQEIMKKFDIEMEDLPKSNDNKCDLEDDDFEIELLSMGSMDRKWTSKDPNNLSLGDSQSRLNESITIIETAEQVHTLMESSRQMIVLESE